MASPSAQGGAAVIDAPAAVPQPNFFIVGAARAGTTSLWYSLRQHPDVFMPVDQKEPHFFCESAPPWAVKRQDDYLRLFAPGRGRSAIGEASTGYLGAPETPGRIAQAYPHAKIIVMLRDPAARAQSLYRLNCSLAVEWKSTFERALAAEEDRFENERFKRTNPYFYEAYLYFRSGLIAESIERYVSTFPRRQLHFVLFDDFAADPDGVTRRVFEFLGVDPDFKPTKEVRNASRFPLWVGGHYGMGQWWKRRTDARAGRSPDWLDTCCALAWHLNLAAGARYRSSSLSPKTRASLGRRYAADVQATSRLIGRDLTAWTA